VPYITIAVPSGTVIGRTFDAKIGAAPGRVTLLSEETLRSYRVGSSFSSGRPARGDRINLIECVVLRATGFCALRLRSG
jgi:hypothetical protein